MRKMAINLPLAPTFFCFTHQLAAEAICQHMNFVEEGSINKFILNFIFYRILLKQPLATLNFTSRSMVDRVLKPPRVY